MKLLGIFSFFSTLFQGIKETFEPTIPAENWANKDLYYQDMMNGVSAEERMRNVKNGRYKMTQTYPEPHRDPVDGKIVIENCSLYKEDVKNYGAYQAQQWVKQGKYNLTPEELEKQREEYKKKWDYLYNLSSNYPKKETQEQQKARKQRESELQQKKKIEQELAESRQLILNECREIMTKAGYNNIDFSLKHRNGIAHEQYGYNIGQITAFKDDEKYIVGFALTTPSNIPENNGNLLLKSLSTIISNVDISDLDNRNLMIKSALELDNNTLLNENSCFSIENDVLSIRVQVCSLEVSLQFYTSKVKRQSLPLNFDNMEGHEFEFFCANLLKNNGYEKINVTRGSGDQGIDIIAYRDGIKYGIQCKCYNSDIGNKAVQEVFAGKTFYECHIGVVLTNQYFTKSATELAKKNGIILWDRNKLISMVEMANSKCD